MKTQKANLSPEQKKQFALVNRLSRRLAKLAGVYLRSKSAEDLKNYRDFSVIYFEACDKFVG